MCSNAGNEPPFHWGWKQSMLLIHQKKIVWDCGENKIYFTHDDYRNYSQV